MIIEPAIVPRTTRAASGSGGKIRSSRSLHALTVVIRCSAAASPTAAVASTIAITPGVRKNPPRNSRMACQRA